MHFGFSIGIYECEDREIEAAIKGMMRDEGFDFVGRNEPWRNITRQDTLSYFQVDDKAMLRKFLIAPTKNKWSRIYPATGWFSEVQEFAIDLSQRLKGTVLY